MFKQSRDFSTFFAEVTKYGPFFGVPQFLASAAPAVPVCPVCGNNETWNLLRKN